MEHIMKRSLPEYIEKAIQQMDPEYTSLSLSSPDDDTLEELISLLNKYNNPYITSLDFTRGNITNEGIKHFANMPKQITQVGLADNNLTMGAAPLLMDVFHHVETLDLCDNDLSHEDALYFIQHSPQTWLSVARNRYITDEDLDDIFAHCYENQAKKENKVEEVSVVKLSQCANLRAIGSELKALRAEFRAGLNSGENEPFSTTCKFMTEFRAAETKVQTPHPSILKDNETDVDIQFQYEKFIVD